MELISHWTTFICELSTCSWSITFVNALLFACRRSERAKVKIFSSSILSAVQCSIDWVTLSNALLKLLWTSIVDIGAPSSFVWICRTSSSRCFWCSITDHESSKSSRYVWIMWRTNGMKKTERKNVEGKEIEKENVDEAFNLSYLLSPSPSPSSVFFIHTDESRFIMSLEWCSSSIDWFKWHCNDDRKDFHGHLWCSLKSFLFPPEHWTMAIDIVDDMLRDVPLSTNRMQMDFRCSIPLMDVRWGMMIDTWSNLSRANPLNNHWSFEESLTNSPLNDEDQEESHRKALTLIFYEKFNGIEGNLLVISEHGTECKCRGRSGN